MISACPVVGIGASAGGLKALKELLSSLPTETGMAYVVIQHLDPNHLSLLPELLAQATHLPIREVKEGIAVEADGIYVCPPNVELTLTQSAFHLSPPDSTSKKSSRSGIIDCFLTSLAHAQREDAVGVVLSGTGSDGTKGLQAIRGAGGITFAQDPASALFPQMPQSAIEAGCIDYVLTCEEIAHVLARMSQQGRVPQIRPLPVLEERASESDFISILHLLSSQSGVDFLSYKPATLRRRVESRMTLLHLAHLSAYNAYLHEHPNEVEALMQSVLISVTEFFRDPIVFEALTRLVWPLLLSRYQRREPLRIWVPGCSTGEEAYSLAISLQEFLQVHASELSFQIFASDVSPKMLAHARTGIYAAGGLATVSPERRERYFAPVDTQHSRYRIDPRIRERCVFAPHNLLRDPPFSRLDMISCRNVLIYLRAPIQQQILQTFHYALLPEGFRLLGTSESTEPLWRLFRRGEPGMMPLYCKKAFGSIMLPHLGKRPGKPLPLIQEEGDLVMTEENYGNGDIQQQADRLLLVHYVPASVVIDTNQEIIQTRGQTDLYLQRPAGRANLNVFKMARPGLSLGLRTALNAARKEGHTIVREGLHVSAFGTKRLVRVTVTPLKGPPANHYCLLVFEEQARLPDAPDAGENTPAPGGRKDKRDRSQERIAELEQELISQQSEMQAILLESDTNSEEVQAASEELLTSNEELKSFNEEIETAREEIQTINEELSTTNQELATLNEQLKTSRNYTESIVETVRTPLIVLTEDLHIKRGNMAFYQFFQVTPQETEGRQLYSLGNGQWANPRLRGLLEEILPTSRTIRDFEVTHHFPHIGHKTLLLNAQRFQNKPFSEYLILLAIEDITERIGVEQQVQAHLTFLQQMLDAVPNSVYLVQGLDARLVLANRATHSLWGATWSIGQPMQDFLQSNHIHIFDAQGNVLPPAAYATMRVLTSGEAVSQHQQTITHANGTTLPVVVNAVPLGGQNLLAQMGVRVDNNKVVATLPMALVAHQDVTFFKEAEELKDRFLGLVSHELRTPLTTIKGYAGCLLETASDQETPLAEWQKEAIDEINLSADLLTLLTNDLLDVVRLQSNRLVMHPEPIHLIELTQHLIAGLQRTTDRLQLTLSVIPASLDELLVLADKNRIQQVLSNLLTNAIKYSPQGGEVEVILHKEEQETVLISIRDQGIGIPQAEQAGIFTRFARASNAETHKISGTGLGLYLCRELVLQHDGQIWFESREGAGSTFFVRLALLSDRCAIEAVEQASTLTSNAR